MLVMKTVLKTFFLMDLTMRILQKAAGSGGLLFGTGNARRKGGKKQKGRKMVSFPGIIAVDNPIIGLQRKNGTRWSGASKCVRRVQQCRQGGWTICELQESFAESTNSAESSYPRKFGGHCVSVRATRYRQQGMCWKFFALR